MSFHARVSYVGLIGTLLLATVPGAAMATPLPTLGAAAVLAGYYGGTILGDVSGSGEVPPESNTANARTFVDPAAASIAGTSAGSNTVAVAHSSGSASGSLATGALRATGTAQQIYSFIGYDADHRPAYELALARSAAHVDVSDVLHINGELSSPTTINVSMQVRGAYSGSIGSGGSVSNEATAYLSTCVPGGGVCRQDHTILVGVTSDGTPFLTEALGTGTTTNGLSPGVVDFTLHATAVVTDATRDIDLLAELAIDPQFANTTSSQQFALDFGHTALLSVELPTGLSYTSLSGVFLTLPADEGGAGDPTSVAEPTTLALLMTALVAFIVHRGARGRRPAFA